MKSEVVLCTGQTTQMETAWLKEHGHLFGYAQAVDGVWMQSEMVAEHNGKLNKQYKQRRNEMASRQYLENEIVEASTLICSRNLVSQRDVDAAELKQQQNRERLNSMDQLKTLLDLIETWKDSYCYTADDGNEVEAAILQHARAFLGKPDADLDECNELLDDMEE